MRRQVRSIKWGFLFSSTDGIAWHFLLCCSERVSVRYAPSVVVVVVVVAAAVAATVVANWLRIIEVCEPFFSFFCGSRSLVLYAGEKKRALEKVRVCACECARVRTAVMEVPCRDWARHLRSASAPCVTAAGTRRQAVVGAASGGRRALVGGRRAVKRSK